MYKVLLWDIDGTILDFKASEKNAIRACFKHFSIGECTDEMIARYSEINDKYWKKLERGELTKPEVLRGRFAEFFSSEGIDFDRIDDFNGEYQVRLGDKVFFFDNSYELLCDLRGKLKQYAVTNGTYIAQTKKLANSGLDKIFDGVFISDKIGAEKPTLEFFRHVFDNIEKVALDEILIIGDSLTSDIKGANNALIPCCYYTQGKPFENTTDLRIDHVISDLNEIYTILGITPTYKEK